jgi:hypothetical protein
MTFDDVTFHSGDVAAHAWHFHGQGDGLVGQGAAQSS